MKYTFPAILALLTTISYGCQSHEEESMAREIRGFSEAFFNYKFSKSLEYCTPESRKWIMFAASNIHEADLEQLQAQETDATVEIEYIDFNDVDSTGIATVKVENCLMSDSIGKAGRVLEEAHFHIPFVCRNGIYIIKMEGLPRNEM